MFREPSVPFFKGMIVGYVLVIALSVFRLAVTIVGIEKDVKASGQGRLRRTMHLRGRTEDTGRGDSELC